jgi:hypothetical protein
MDRGVRSNIQLDRAGITVFRGFKLRKPARQLSLTVRRTWGHSRKTWCVMTKRAPQQLDVAAYSAFVTRFHEETDRAAAVLAGGYLDAFMEAALRSVLVAGARLDALFDAQGALRSFGSKISLAAALGLVTEDLARDMDLVRKVRNHFAHHIWEASFDGAPVRDWCKAIGVVDSAVNRDTGERVLDSNPPRIRYLLAVGMSTMLVAHSPKVPSQFRELMTGIRQNECAAQHIYGPECQGPDAERG